MQPECSPLPNPLGSASFLAVPAELGFVGRDGQFLVKWYPLLSILAVPLSRSPHRQHTFCGCGPLPGRDSLAHSARCFYGRDRHARTADSLRLGSSTKGAILAALSYAFGTIALAYAPHVLCGAACSRCLPPELFTPRWASPRQVAYAGICSTFAVLLNRPELLSGRSCAVSAAKSRSLETRRHPGLGSFAGLALYCVYNYKGWSPTDVRPTMVICDGCGSRGLVRLIAEPWTRTAWYCRRSY